MSNLFGKKRSKDTTGKSSDDLAAPAASSPPPSPGQAAAPSGADTTPPAAGARPGIGIESPLGPPPLPGRRSTGSGIMHPQSRRGVGSANPPPAEEAPAPATPAQTTRQLVVGKEIVLSGEIQSCEQLLVEGRVEAQLSDSGALEIAESGHFKGTAMVESADISGNFEGDLYVSGILLLRTTGRILGDIYYGELQIERGGRIKGAMDLYDPAAIEARFGAATETATVPEAEQPMPEEAVAEVEPEAPAPESSAPESPAPEAPTQEIAESETVGSETAEADAPKTKKTPAPDLPLAPEPVSASTSA